ncbi:MAG: MATE family efflux transporter [Spirochaetales bacterium]
MQPNQSMRRIVSLGVPLLFARLTHYLHQIVDSAMLGHYGDGSLELAAIGVAGLFAWILNTMLWPLSNGIQAITSRRFGREDSGNPESRYQTGGALDNGLITALYASGIAIGASFLARPILSLMLSTPQILELSVDYISIVRFGLLPSGFYFAIQGFLAAVNQTKYAMWSSIISNVLNIILNYILIFGRLGFPEMGIRGAALGTALSMTVACAFLVAVAIKGGYASKYRLFRFRNLSRRVQRDIVRVAIPPGVQNVIALSIFMTYQTLIEDYSAIYLAATHAVFAFFRLNKTMIGGFARSAGILAGNALGRGEKDDAHRLIGLSGVLGAILALVVGVATWLLRSQIAGLFSNDPATIAAIVDALTFFLPFYFVEALGYSFEMVFVSNGYGRYVLASEFSTNVVFILGATIAARLLLPEMIRYAWLSFGLYQVSHALIMVLGFARKRWVDVEVERAT